jgi:hypothetical protein
LFTTVPVPGGGAATLAVGGGGGGGGDELTGCDTGALKPRLAPIDIPTLFLRFTQITLARTIFLIH